MFKFANEWLWFLVKLLLCYACCYYVQALKSFSLNYGSISINFLGTSTAFYLMLSGTLHDYGPSAGVNIIHMCLFMVCCTYYCCMGALALLMQLKASILQTYTVPGLYQASWTRRRGHSLLLVQNLYVLWLLGFIYVNTAYIPNSTKVCMCECWISCLCVCYYVQKWICIMQIVYSGTDYEKQTILG